MSTEPRIVETPWAKPIEEVIASESRLLESERAGETSSTGQQGEDAPTGKHSIEDSGFFDGKSVAQLAREQGVGPIQDIRVFAGVIPDEDDIDEMLAEIYQLREP